MAEIKEEIIRNIEKELLELEETSDLGFNQLLNILKERQKDRKTKRMPLSVFDNDKLSALESIVKYLKENLGLNYREISILLKRNYDPIAITYRNSKKKLPTKLNIVSDNNIPIEIFGNKELSILENIVSYLREKMELSYHEIAVLLRRDDRTIWTVYNRVTKKRR